MPASFDAECEFTSLSCSTKAYESIDALLPEHTGDESSFIIDGTQPVTIDFDIDLK